MIWHFMVIRPLTSYSVRVSVTPRRVICRGFGGAGCARKDGASCYSRIVAVFASATAPEGPQGDCDLSAHAKKNTVRAKPTAFSFDNTLTATSLLLPSLNIPAKGTHQHKPLPHVQHKKQRTSIKPPLSTKLLRQHDNTTEDTAKRPARPLKSRCKFQVPQPHPSSTTVGWVLHRRGRTLSQVTKALSTSAMRAAKSLYTIDMSPFRLSTSPAF